jgi:GDP-L-fucose synthase
MHGMNKDSKIYVAGHTGLVGGSLCRHLKANGYYKTTGVKRSDLDLLSRSQVVEWFAVNRPEYVFLAAAKVGGIHANDTYPAEFIYQNLTIQTNVIDTCFKYGVHKLLFLGSVCIYPKYAEVPVKEESLLTGELEPTNQWYAVAKIAGIKMAQAYRKQYGVDFISIMPCNLYGVGDNFHPENSHVIPALIRRFLEAKAKNAESVTCWGTGAARREFLYVDDMADACTFVMNNYSDSQIINIGFGADYTIKELVELIAELTQYEGKILWDTSKPDGTPKRMLDTTKLQNLGWKPKVSLREGLTKTIEWYKLQTTPRDV